MKRKRYLTFILAVILTVSLLPAGQAGADWSSDCQNFVLNQEYLSTGLRFSDNAYNKPLFSLCDLDKNGTLELLILNGLLPESQSEIYVFTCEDGQIRHAGSLRAGSDQPYRVETSPYPGIFADWGTGTSHQQIYYELQGGQIAEIPVQIIAMNEDMSRTSTQLTEDSGLYAYAVSCHDSSFQHRLPFYSLDNIRTMGWAEFLKAEVGISAAPAAGTVVSMSVQQQFAANIFLSNFSEQHAFEKRSFDVNSWHLDDLVGFAYLYCKINRRSALSTAEVNGSYYYTLSLEEANRVWDRHFGFTLSEAEAERYPLTPQSYETRYSNFYASGTFYFPAADGEAYNRFTVVRRMEDLGDGRYRLLFDIYKLDINEYWRSNGVESGFYYLSASDAERDSRLSLEASGVAYVRPYVNNGNPTYQLLRYRLGEEDVEQARREIKRIYTKADSYSAADPTDPRGGSRGLGGNYEEFQWGSFLFETPSTQLYAQLLSDKNSASYNLALLCGILSLNAYQPDYLAQAYMDLGVDETAISYYSYPDSRYNRPDAKRDGSEFARDNDLAFSLASMQMPINGVDTDILFITVCGTHNTFEGINDGMAGADKDFYGYTAWNWVWEFEEDIFAGIADHQKSHPELGTRPMKILVTGHSLGGAAANLAAARLNRLEWYAGAITVDDVYCYTFGAIDSILNVHRELTILLREYNWPPETVESITREMSKMEFPVTTGFENILNIYNYYDTFGPYTMGTPQVAKDITLPFGWKINARGCSGYGKFGWMVSFYDYMRGKFPGSGWPTHEILGYVQAVKKGSPVLDPYMADKIF